ncbi:MAG: TonB-dependent receptor [Bacteroidota bacterium]
MRSFSQETAKFSGEVIDATSGQALVGASIFIEGSNLGAYSNEAGEFRIVGIPPGERRIILKYFGYQNIDTLLTFSGGDNVFISFQLQEMVYEGEEIVIETQAKAQLTAINEQLKDNRIVNIVAGEKLRELPDANAAESIGRLPGVSLKRSSGEASGVVIRGLSPKYNNVTIGGVKVASTNAQDRSVDLSIITGENLGGIEVSKSLRADMDADAIGGTINLRLQNVRKGLHFRTQAEGGYNELGNSYDNYRFVGQISNRFFKDRLGIHVDGKIERKDIPSDIFNTGYSDPIFNQVLDPDGNLVEESRFLNTERATLEDRGLIRSRQAATIMLDTKVGPWSLKGFYLFNQKVDDRESWRVNNNFLSLRNPFSYSASVNKSDIRLNNYVLQNELSLGKSELQVNLSYAKTTNSTPGQDFNFLEEQLNNPGIPLASRRNALPDTLLNKYGQTNVQNTYLQNINRSTFDLQDEHYDVRLDWSIPFHIGKDISGKFSIGGKYHVLQRKSDAFRETTDFQFGGGSARRIPFVSLFPEIDDSKSTNRGLWAPFFSNPSYDPGNFLAGRYQIYWGPDFNRLVEVQNTFRSSYSAEEIEGFYVTDGVSSLQRDYEAREDQWAGYAMAEFNIGDKLMLLPGLRYERENTSYSGFHIIRSTDPSGILGTPEEVVVERENAFFFPSLNAKYKISEAIQVQGAIYRSQTRPDFRQLSTQILYGINPGDFFRSNNPFLKPSLAMNYDLGLSIFNRKLGLLSFNLFYKRVDDLIFNLARYEPLTEKEVINTPPEYVDILPDIAYYDTTYLGAAATTSIPINNPEPSFYYGIEASWQTSFWHLPKPFSGLVLDLNATLIRSRTQYPHFDGVVVGYDTTAFGLIEIPGISYDLRKGAMVDQPQAILNAVLGWDHKGFSARISYRYQARVLQGPDSRFELKDSYYDSFTFVDVALKQKLNKYLSIYFNATNLTNHVDDFFFLEQGEVPNLPTSSNSFGRRAQIGITFQY